VVIDFFNPSFAIDLNNELNDSSAKEIEKENKFKNPIYLNCGKEKPISDFIWFYSIYLDLITTDFKFLFSFFFFHLFNFTL
jgi:hypothetical protein